MIELQETSGGLLLPVQAQPGARKAGVVGEHAGRLKIAVTEPPDRGRANEAIAELLAELFDLRLAQVELKRGATSRQKQFLLTECDPAAVRARLDELLQH